MRDTVTSINLCLLLTCGRTDKDNVTTVRKKLQQIGFSETRNCRVERAGFTGGQSVS